MDGAELTDAETQIRKELQSIVAVLQDLTGRASRWSGRIELVQDAEFKGKKHFTCAIQIDADVARRDTRWSTLIHEVFHSLSAGYVATDFRLYRGWEEGVVEQLQRLFRPAILTQLHITVGDEIFDMEQAAHPFNTYLQALESIRLAVVPNDTSETREAFYMDLLVTPIRDRFSSVLRRAFTLSGEEQIAFIATLSSANAILTRKAL